jgi:hypothetical protein
MTKEEYEFARGWDEALDLVFDVITTMKNSKTVSFDIETLNELEQRIV